MTYSSDGFLLEPWSIHYPAMHEERFASMRHRPNPITTYVSCFLSLPSS